MKEPIYLKFNNPSSGNRPPRWLRIMTSLIPNALKGSPDWDMKMHLVRTWLVEFTNDENEYASREIGFDNDGSPIVFSPWRRNFGLWTDEDIEYNYFIDKFDATQISKQEFEKYWNKFIQNNPDDD